MVVGTGLEWQDGRDGHMEKKKYCFRTKISAPEKLPLMYGVSTAIHISMMYRLVRGEVELPT